MKGRLSESISSETTLVNAPPIQEMKSSREKKSAESSSSSAANNSEHTSLEMRAL